MKQNKGGRLLHSCLNMRKHLSRTIGEARLSHGEYLVLRFISNSASRDDGRLQSIRAALLSDTLDISRPAISRILNVLENRELITRSIDKTDRRGVSIEITQKGTEELKKTAETTLEKAERIASRLGDEETETLIRLLDKLSDILRDMADEKGGDNVE